MITFTNPIFKDVGKTRRLVLRMSKCEFVFRRQREGVTKDFYICTTNKCGVRAEVYKTDRQDVTSEPLDQHVIACRKLASTRFNEREVPDQEVVVSGGIEWLDSSTLPLFSPTASVKKSYCSKSYGCLVEASDLPTGPKRSSSSFALGDLSMANARACSFPPWMEPRDADRLFSERLYNASKPGVALLVYFEETEGCAKLPYAKYDSSRLQQLLEDEYGFEVHCYSDLSHKELKKAFELFVRSDFSDYSCALVHFVGHGCRVGLSPKSGEVINFDWFVDGLDSSKSLSGRPKLVMFDCCYGTSEQSTPSSLQSFEQDGSKPELPWRSDTLIVHSSQPGRVSYFGYPLVGSHWFTANLCYVMEKWRNWSVTEWLQEVNFRLSHMLGSNKKGKDLMQLSLANSSLRANFYLRPKPQPSHL